MKSQETLFDTQADKIKNASHEYAAFFQKIAEVDNPVEKIEKTLVFMKECLKEDGSFNRQSFWKAKLLCIELFKESIDKAKRYQLWKEFIELIRQGRVAEKLLSQNTQFLYEQILKAVELLEKESKQEPKQSPKDLTEKCIPYLKSELIGLEKNQAFYEFYHTLVLRYRDLKNELVASQMHYREKKQLFERLDPIAHVLFTSRKEYITRISDSFEKVVVNFCNAAFDGTKTLAPIYVLKEQVKLLQNLAKELGLNSTAFKATRLKLSELWGKLKDFEKERKKESVEKRRYSKQNLNIVEQKIEELKKVAQAKHYDLEAIEREENTIIRYARTLEMEREDRLSVKEKLQELKRPFIEIQSHQIEKQKLEEQKQTHALQKVYFDLEQDAEKLIAQNGDLSFDVLDTRLREFNQKMSKAHLDFSQKQTLDKKLSILKAIYHEKKEKAILEQIKEGETPETLRALKVHLEDKRMLFKKEYENLKKELKNCGLDVEKSVQIQESIQTTKESLEKVNAQLQETDLKLNALME
ncbi:MAG: hypothetical protein K940chlam8_00636 [Chlamydiae bacterium]|nr:hypothetical protein [Chlamydiota bacterium]